MKKQYNDLITLQYNGLIQNNTNKVLLQSLAHKLNALKDEKIRAYVISFKNAYCESDMQAARSLLKQLNVLRKKEKLSISLVEYSEGLYQVLKIAAKYSEIDLFESLSIAQVFLYPQDIEASKSIAIYDTDKENAQKTMSKLAQFDFKATIIEDKATLEKYSNDVKYVIIKNTTLNRGSQAGKAGLNLSKNLIMNLPIFMDTAVETLVSYTSFEASKKAHNIHSFDTNIEGDSISALMKFNGSFDGVFVLVFPKKLALITMESLLGEVLEENNTEAIQDGIAELCNIITGSAKTLFSNKGFNLTFELPRTFLSVKELSDEIGSDNGVWITMHLDGKPFYMFITK